MARASQIYLHLQSTNISKISTQGNPEWSGQYLGEYYDQKY